jgi:hypothetical protein
LEFFAGARAPAFGLSPFSPIIKRLRRKKKLYAEGVLNPVRRTPLPFSIFHFAFLIFNLLPFHEISH